MSNANLNKPEDLKELELIQEITQKITQLCNISLIDLQRQHLSIDFDKIKNIKPMLRSSKARPETYFRSCIKETWDGCKLEKVVIFGDPYALSSLRI